MAEGGWDPLDFFNLQKPFKKIYIKGPTPANEYKRTEFDEPPPETDSSLVCAESDWREFIQEEERKLTQVGAESYHGGASDAASVVNSDMFGIEGQTTATRTAAAASDASVNAEADPANLTEMYNFNKNEGAWKLPIIDMKETILDTIAGNQIIILSGPTGCGKSTQVPQYILDHLAFKRKMVNIIVTQPRKIAARSVAERVCQERGWNIGGLVGYQVGLDKAHKSQDTRLLYVTTGILKRFIINKKNLQDYTHIILDEVHERDEDMDLVMLLCKKLLNTNSRRTKLILMSATLDDKKLSLYFSSFVPGLGDVPAATVQVGTQKSNNVREFYIDQLQFMLKKFNIDPADIEPELAKPTFYEENSSICKLIIKHLDILEEKERGQGKSGEPGAVLVFLPGLHEIQQVRDVLMEEDDKVSDVLKWWCIPLHSSVSWEEQQRIYQASPPHTRKIILSTNIAESSLTVPDIKYVVDFCLTKNVQSDKETNYPRLMLDWACKNQLIQRKGRAGRVHKDGRVFRLIPQAFYNHSLKQSHVPEMQRVPLTKVILDVKMLNMGSPKQLLALAMDPPNIENLPRSIIGLKEIGALLTTVSGVHVRDDGDLTCMGEIMGRLPLDVKLSKLIIFGHIFGVLEESIIIAAGLNGKSIFTAPFDRRVQSFKNKIYWADRTFSDCFAILFAYQTWHNRRETGEFRGKNGADAEKNFCKTSFLQRRSLQEMRLLVEDITKSLKLMDIEPLQIQNPVKWNGDSRYTILKLVMFGAFYPNYFTKHVSSEVEINANRTLLGKDPRTTVYMQGMDENHSKFGDIYAGQIKNLFVDCTKNEEKINLTFDGRKIFVEFDRFYFTPYDQKDEESEKIGSTGIVNQVYVAVKLRNSRPLGKKLDINLYGSLELAEEKHKEWKKMVENAKDHQLSSPDLEQISPPGRDKTSLNIERITHVSNPSLFWVHTMESSQLEMRVQEIISQVLRHCTQVSKYDIKEGCLYLAPFKDEDGDTQFYRARVDKILNLSVMVFFVDFGNNEKVDLRDLRVLSANIINDFPELVTIPGLALECCLASVKPNTLRNAKGLYDDLVINAFREMINAHTGGKLICNIFSVTKSGHGRSCVNLDNLPLKYANNVTVDAKKKMLDEGLVDEAVESYLSQSDHRDRMRYNAYSSAMKTHLSHPYPHDKAPNMKSMTEDKSQQHIKMSLQGPFSPLEHKILCGYRNGSTKLSNIDPQSVNSVLLDHSPSDQFDQFMVAASVGMSPNSDALLLRNTSWLPSKPGLGAMSIMMFAPQVELRLSEDKTSIIGFIAGLGPKMSWDKPMEKVTKLERTYSSYPEHDLEVKVDFPLTNQDVNTINKIRYRINQMLMKTEDGVMNLTLPMLLDTAQKGFKKNLDELLSCPRKRQDKRCLPSGHEYRWNMLDQKQRLKSKIVEQDKFVFKMIDGVRGLETNNNKAVIEKLISMYTRMDELDCNPLPYHEFCPVCPGQIMLNTPRDLFSHLATDSHKTEESLVVDTADSETIASSSLVE